MFKLSLLVPVLTLFFVGCADKVSVEELNAEQVFVLKCVLQEDEAPVASLQMTSSLDGGSFGGFIKTAVIELKDGTDSKHMLIYDPISGKYIGDPGRVNPGKEYKIFVSDVNYEGKDLLVETNFPTRTPVDSINANIISTLNSKDQISVEIHLPELNNKNAYLHIIPRRRRAIQSNDEIRYLELEKANIAYIYNNNFVVQELFHAEGVVVDYERLEDKTIKMDLESLPLEDGEFTPSIHFDIVSVTKDYYHYYIARSNQLRDARDLNGTPAISYSNVNNGYGLFTSKIVVKDSTLVR